jgi:uncharacterized membrane protein YebE (DUF533 family)
MVKVPEGYRSKDVEDRRQPSVQRQSGGRGSSDLLGSILGSNATGGGLLGSILGGGGSGGGGIGDLLGAVLGGTAGAGGSSGAGSSAGAGGLGSILGSILGGAGGAQSAPPALTRDEQDTADNDAELLIRAMINAAKADGQIDQAEVDNIVGRLGDIDQNEAAFLRRELAAPLDLDGYCRSVPGELAQQAYAFSVMGMKLDTQQEAQYLGAVAQGLGLNPQICNAIHDKLGAPQIFR